MLQRLVTAQQRLTASWGALQEWAAQLVLCLLLVKALSLWPAAASLKQRENQAEPREGTVLCCLQATAQCLQPAVVSLKLRRSRAEHRAARAG